MRPLVAVQGFAIQQIPSHVIGPIGATLLKFHFAMRDGSDTEPKKYVLSQVLKCMHSLDTFGNLAIDSY